MAHRIGASLNSGLERNKEEEEGGGCEVYIPHVVVPGSRV